MSLLNGLRFLYYVAGHIESLSKYAQYDYYRDIFITGTEDERRDFMKICAKEITNLEERFTQKHQTKRSVSHER